MIRRTCHAHLAALAIAVVSLAANAAYITPWYVNPALKDRFWLGVDSFTPTDLAIGADATRLAIAAKPEGASDIIRVYDLGNLVYSANVVQTNRHATAYTASTAGLNGSPRLAVNADGLVGVDAAGGTAAKFTFESRKWVGRYAPEARTFAAAPDATSFALDSTGALWSNATGAGREGLLVKRTLSGTAYAEADTVATGLTAVDAVAVYTVNGVEYALAAAQGKVVRVNVSTKAVATLVDDATHLGAAVRSVKMSHTDYFRPRLYMLLATGDIAVYYLDETVTTATWSKNLSNGELLAAVRAPYAAADAMVEAFEVTPDGGSAFLAYKANDGATATGLPNVDRADDGERHGPHHARNDHNEHVGTVSAHIRAGSVLSPDLHRRAGDGTGNRGVDDGYPVAGHEVHPGASPLGQADGRRSLVGRPDDGEQVRLVEPGQRYANRRRIVGGLFLHQQDGGLELLCAGVRDAVAAEHAQRPSVEQPRQPPSADVQRGGLLAGRQGQEDDSDEHLRRRVPERPFPEAADAPRGGGRHGGGASVLRRLHAGRVRVHGPGAGH